MAQALGHRLGKATVASDHDNTHARLLQCISSMEPDSQQRVDAIKSAEVERDIKTANRVNPMDEQLSRQKGLLRAPSARKESSMKRLSAEIKERVEEIMTGNDVKDTSTMSTVGLSKSPTAEIKSTDSLREKTTKNTEGSVKIPQGASGVSVAGDTEFQFKKETDISVELALDLKSVTEPGTQMPDIAAEAVRSERENSPQCSTPTPSGGEKDEESSSFSIVTSDSEQDSTLESPHSIEESVKPGHVKDMIAKVVSIAKSGEVSEEAQGRARFSAFEDGGAEYDRVNQFVAIDKGSPSKPVLISPKGNAGKPELVSAKGSPGKSEVLSPKGSPGRPEAFFAEASNKTPTDEDDVYVAKTFPELAQVFEQGELKAKKRKGKADKEKVKDKQLDDKDNTDK